MPQIATARASGSSRRSQTTSYPFPVRSEHLRADVCGVAKPFVCLCDQSPRQMAAQRDERFERLERRERGTPSDQKQLRGPVTRNGEETRTTSRPDTESCPHHACPCPLRGSGHIGHSFRLCSSNTSSSLACTPCPQALDPKASS